MFSANVIWAVHILSELDKHRAEVSARKQNKKSPGMRFTATSPMQKSVLRCVLKRLVSVGYIELLPSPQLSYKLKTDIRQITIIGLIRIFHGGICMGEIYDHYQTVGKEMFRTGEYGKLLLFENKLRQSIEKQLLTMHIGELQK